MSVSKSITGLVAGALAGRGALDVTATVDTIVPELKDTSFRGATVQQLLDMRTGTRFGEDYDDPEAEIAVSDRVYLWSPDDGKAAPGATRSSTSPPWSTTARTAAPSATGRSSSTCSPGSWRGQADERFPDLVGEELWQPMGAEHDAEITVDAHGNAAGRRRHQRHPARRRPDRPARPAAGPRARRWLAQVVPADLARRHHRGRARRPGRRSARRRRDRLPAGRALPQLLVGHDPGSPCSTPPASTASTSSCTSQPDRRGQAVQLAGGAQRPNAPRQSPPSSPSPTASKTSRAGRIRTGDLRDPNAAR